MIQAPGYSAIWTLRRAASSPLGLVTGLAVFLAGTAVRVHFEEKLLRRRFGVAFEEYAAAVPAFLPRLGWSGLRRAGGQG